MDGGMRISREMPVDHEGMKMLEFVLEYWVDFLFGVIIAGMSLAYKKLAKKVKEAEYVKEGVLAMLHDRLFQAGRYYIAKNEITLDELKNVEYLYNGYHNLGGNGTGTEIWERVKNLPIKKEGE